MKAVVRAALGALLFVSGARASVEPYLAARHGTKCDLEADGALTCRYRIGASLEFTLKRVGEPGVRLDVLRNEREGDYALDPQPSGPCYIVRHGWSARPAPGAERNTAAISTVNGVAYRTLRECRRAK
ncbi:MAG: hypothetical protein OEZ09_13890 [Betaproteobacteria bacterium]|nr:hypothetical protein [Betaproteobacteria bacterium]MDH4324887.1 hypothetical protein [Betaproteobacteria bacterium]MDH5579533.1 hypothetical protein [Betaproteobacteria bacterium]